MPHRAWLTGLGLAGVVAFGGCASMSRMADLNACRSAESNAAIVEACTKVADSPETSGQDRAFALLRRADAYDEGKQHARAAADIEAAVAAAPDAPEPYAGRYQVRMGRGELEGARADLDAAIAKLPVVPVADADRIDDSFGTRLRQSCPQFKQSATPDRHRFCACLATTTLALVPRAEAAQFARLATPDRLVSSFAVAPHVMASVLICLRDQLDHRPMAAMSPWNDRPG